MTNWVTNNITITGPDDTLELFLKERLSFSKLHPRPEMEDEGESDSTAWNLNNWGTKWEPDAICPLLVNGRMVASFDTAWMPPTAFLVYLTEFYEGVKVINRFEDEAFCFVGHSVIEMGVDRTEFLEPTDFTYDALREFAKSNTWFNYKKFELMVHSLHDCYSDTECTCLDISGWDLKDVVSVKPTL